MGWRVTLLNNNCLVEHIVVEKFQAVLNVRQVVNIEMFVINSETQIEWNRRVD